MELCAKCGKQLNGEFFKTIYGEFRCSNCYDDYLMTDHGKAEYILGIAKGDFPMSDFDADFLGYASVCWNKYRDEFDLTLLDLYEIEAEARKIGIL